MELKEKRNETLKSPTGPIQPHAEILIMCLVSKKSGCAPMKFISSVAASQAMSSMTGCKRNVNSSMRRRQKKNNFESRVKLHETSRLHQR
jgi:hypothetical protein